MVLKNKMVSVEPTARGLQTLCPSEPCDLVGKATGVTDRRMGESARGGRRVGISGSKRLWARVGRLRQKVLETTECRQGMKRRPRAFLCLPSSSGLQLSSRAPPPAPPGPQTRPRPGPGRRDLGAFAAAHDTYCFRIWRADGSPR